MALKKGFARKFAKAATEQKAGRPLRQSAAIARSSARRVARKGRKPGKGPTMRKGRRARLLKLRGRLKGMK